MIKSYPLLTFLIFIFFSNHNENISTTNSGSINIYLTTNSTTHAAAHAHPKTDIHTSIASRSMHTFQDYFFNKLPTWSQKNGSFLYQHKIKIGLGILFFAYACLQCKLYNLERCISNTEVWSSWKSHLILNDLLVLDQKELTRELLHAIQKKYAAPDNLHNFVLPLVYFMQEFENEIATLKQLISIHEWLCFCRLSHIFFIKKSTIERAKERISRLYFLHNILTTWMSDYKLERNAFFRK